MGESARGENPWLSAGSWFSGKSVLVVGGTTGIGAAVSRCFLELGAEVVSTGVTDDELAHAATDESLSRAKVRHLDVSAEASISGAIDSLTELDCLINCAGMATENEYEAGDFRRVMDVNLNGAMILANCARPKLAANKGAIVMIASVLGFFGSAKYPAYAASKGAVVQLTRSLAIAWAREGIRVNAIAPGYIETPMTVGLRESATRNAEIMHRTPLDRWGLPSEIADGAVYLCSPVASFVTGTTLFIDGGFSAF